MGALCSCFCESNDEPTHRTPLLTGGQNKPVTSQHVPSYVKTSSTTSQSAVTQPPPPSARQHRPEALKEQDFVTSLDHVAPVSLHQLPAQLAALNKTFQDHAKLYNEQHDHFKQLRQAVNDFKAKFVADTSGIPVMADCLRILADRCGGATLTAKREKRCIQLQYDAREVSEKCTGLPEDTLEALELYNKINRQVKSILDKSPQVSRSLELVLEEEHNLKKEVTKADLSNTDGPEALRRCTENINRLRKLPGFIETIQKYTEKSFKEVLEGSKVLLKEIGTEVA
ncbi:uncharacterized protein [Littorina saxatilis]|uniref:Uncharacterized protein n=1 Tax=Littorina saxatilis TaxID=31220 RepID=A0AAN9FVE4_9CAEN